MAIRIRTNRRMFCAAHRPAELGDIYVDDAVHYHLSSVVRVLVSEGMEKHLINPEWWWRHDVPSCVEIADHYRTAISSAAEPSDAVQSVAKYSAGDICRDTNGPDVCDSADYCERCQNEAEMKNLMAEALAGASK